MNTSTLALKGEIKLIQVRPQANSDRRICRVFKPTEQVPENVLFECFPHSDIYKDKVTKEYFKHTPQGMVTLKH